MVVKAVPYWLVAILVILICVVAVITWVSLDILFGDFINNQSLILSWRTY